MSLIWAGFISLDSTFNNVRGVYLVKVSLFLICQQGLEDFRYQLLLPICWRIVQILRQCRRKTTNKAPTALSAIQASSYYTPLVIRRNDKNKQLTLLSQRKLALEVLSSEMDPAGIAKLGSFNRSSLKKETSEKSARPPSSESPSKY